MNKIRNYLRKWLGVDEEWERLTIAHLKLAKDIADLKNKTAGLTHGDDVPVSSVLCRILPSPMTKRKPKSRY